MKKTILLPLAIGLVFAACKKEDTRGVTYKTECQHCILTYTDKGGNSITEEVYGTWEKKLSMQSGDLASIAVCGWNSPVGGTTGTIGAHNGNAVWVYLDGNSWSEESESTWGSPLDSVPAPGNLWRKVYTDTCASAEVVIPKK